MKAKLLFTIILTFLSVSFSKAQSWVQNDAVWHYDYYMTGYGFYKVSLGNDTIIAGRTCQRYITEKHQFFPQPGNVFVAGPVVDYPQRFTSVSGDTVFHYENDTFYTLFNFGASVGDQWVINDNYSHFNCDSVSKVKVIETDVLTINGTSRRAIRLTTIEGSPKGIEGWVVENRSEEHTSELQSRPHLVCRLLLEKKNANRRRRRSASSGPGFPCSGSTCPPSAPWCWRRSGSCPTSCRSPSGPCRRAGGSRHGRPW